MGLFGSKLNGELDAILTEITKLKREVAGLRGERDALKDKKKLDDEISTLKKDLTEKQIQYDRELEKWSREKRETEHLVGLQKKRGEFEIEAASQKATLAVREENLKSERKQFDEQMKFTKEHFDQQFEALNNLMEKFLERMPTTKQLINVGSNGRSVNGDDD